LFKRGRYEEAAPIFERLAAGAARRGMPFRGADLFGRAAQCHLELGHTDRAVALGKRSLVLLARMGRRNQVRARLSRMIEALTQKGYRDEAAALQKEAESFLRGESDAQALSALFPGAPRRRPQLPAACSHCGAPVNLNQVTWAGPDRAECAYCDGIITAAAQP
jgi:hypothetical protein